MIRHGATALARQSGRCHHPHIPVRSRGRAVVPRAAAPSSVFRKWYYTTEAARCGLWRSPALPCGDRLNLLSRECQSRVGWCTRRRQDRAAPARATARTRVCATPSREMCGANIGSRLLQDARGPPITAHTLSSEAPISTCSWPNLCTRYALRVRTHREIHTLRSLSGGR